MPRAVASGQAEIGGHYQPNLYLDHEVGVLLVPIGTLVETPLNTLTVLADGPIDGLTDLAGKRIGFSVSGFEEVTVAAAASTPNVHPDVVLQPTRVFLLAEEAGFAGLFRT